MGREVGGASGLGTHVHSWWIHVNVWQSQYSIVKQNKVKIKIEKKKSPHSKKDPAQPKLNDENRYQKKLSD